MYQDGMVFHAGTLDGSASAAAAIGRCSAAISAALLAGRSAQKTRRKSTGLM
jgi:hypothetical protein